MTLKWKTALVQDNISGVRGFHPTFEIHAVNYLEILFHKMEMTEIILSMKGWFCDYFEHYGGVSEVLMVAHRAQNITPNATLHATIVVRM